MGLVKYFGSMNNGNFEVKSLCLNLDFIEHCGFSAKKGFNSAALGMGRKVRAYCRRKKTILCGLGHRQWRWKEESLEKY